MQVTYLLEEEKDHYGLKLFIGLAILIVILSYTSLYAIQNYYSPSFFSFSKKDKQVYFLESKTLKSMYASMDMDYSTYTNRLQKFEDLLDNYGYVANYVSSEKLKSIDKHSIVLILDMVALSDDEIKNVNTFVEHGGKALLNFTSGFLNTSFSYRSNNLVKNITGLTLSKKHSTIKFNKKNVAYLSTRLLSPVTQFLPEGYGLSLPLYDPLPIFKTDRHTDGYLSNWSQTRYASLGKNNELSAQEGGVLWHGYKGKGKWVYFSFPSYVLTENASDNYKKLLQGMLAYLEDKISIQMYPYIDAKNAVFVSEDTEYKYENLKQFYNVSKKYNFPVTVYCVASLALKNKKLMDMIKKAKNIEIGSHSYTHKKIVNESDAVYEREIIGSKKVLNQFSKTDIIGFRAPREEVDEKIIGLLEDANYKYILDAGDNRIYPYYKDDILIIPKHATDDYSFLINLDWNSKQILNVMKKEVNMVVRLDGLYTLSTHTHLMSFGSNIKITDKFFKYIKSQHSMTPMNGKMIYERASKYLNLSTKSTITKKKMILTISNDNALSVKNVHYEITVDPGLVIKNIESEIIGLKTHLKKTKNGKYVLTIDTLKPKSQIVLFLNYVQNS